MGHDGQPGNPRCHGGFHCSFSRLRSRAEFLNLAAAYDALADRLEKQSEGARKVG